jgi:hypothetical protein
VPELATAQNNDKSDDQQTLRHSFSAEAESAVHFIPSGEYITLLVQLQDTATNNAKSGDQQTLIHALYPAASLNSHVIPPSSDVIT